MNPTYAGLELKRFARDRTNLFFVAILPAFFYLVFGAAQDYRDAPVGNGNVAFYIMVSMAAYGAVTATVGIGGMAAVERMQGWGRQLGLTPLPDRGFVTVKSFLALAVAAVPIGLIAVLGGLTGASAQVWTWLVSIAVIVVGATVFALFGLCAGLAFRTEAAVGAASGIMVIMAFLGNLFIPLTGTLLAIAKFTPLYGYVALARFPATEGRLIDGRGGLTDAEPLWIPVLNVSVWAAVFAVAAVWLVRRGRGRQ